MFDIGLEKLITLGALGVIIFGPDKLPKLAADAARMLHQLRRFTQAATQDLKAELGPEFTELHLDDLHPRTFIRKNLLEGEAGLGELTSDLRVRLDAPLSFPPRQLARLHPGERPPYDTEAT